MNSQFSGECEECQGKPDDYVFTSNGGFILTCGMLKKTFLEVTLPKTHNSAISNANPGLGWSFAYCTEKNHDIGMVTMLERGVRILDLDVGRVAGYVKFRHGGGTGFLHPTTNLKAIKEHLDRNRRDFVIIQIGDICSGGNCANYNKEDTFNDLIKRFIDSDLYNYLYNFSFKSYYDWTTDYDYANVNWPTLQQMINSNKRVILFSQKDISPSNQTYSPIPFNYYTFLASDNKYYYPETNKLENFDSSRYRAHNITNATGSVYMGFDDSNCWATARSSSRIVASGVRAYEAAKRLENSLVSWSKNVSQIEVDFFTGAHHVGGERDISVVDAANRLNYERFGYDWSKAPYTWKSFPNPGTNLLLNIKNTANRGDKLTDGELTSYEWSSGGSYYVGGYKKVQTLALSGWFDNHPRNLKLEGSNNNYNWTRLYLSQHTRFDNPSTQKNYLLSDLNENRDTWWTYEVTNPGNYMYYRISHTNDETFEYALYETPWYQSDDQNSKWVSNDIGNPDYPGSHSEEHSTSDITFTVEGGGSDIWGSEDQFQFTHRKEPIDGDVEMFAKLVSMSGPDQWSKAGIMVRESLNSNSKYFNVLMSRDFGVRVQYRLNTGGISYDISAPSNINVNPPVWLRILRTGNTIKGYAKNNLTDEWTQIAGFNYSMSEFNYGLSVTAHLDSQSQFANGVYNSVAFFKPGEVNPFKSYSSNKIEDFKQIEVVEQTRNNLAIRLNQSLKERLNENSEMDDPYFKPLILSVKVYDFSGNLILEKESLITAKDFENEIDLGKLPKSGFYIISSSLNGEKLNTKKIYVPK